MKFYRSFNSDALSIVILCFLGIVIYSNTLDSPFHFDDDAAIVRNLNIRNITDIRAIWKFWPTRFVTFLSFAANYHIWKLDTFGYHLFNLTIHLGSSVLVWWLTLLTFSTPVMKKDPLSALKVPVAFFAGAVFVSHPIQTEAITYIVQRATSQAAFFYLFSLCLYANALLLEEERTSRYTHALYYCASLVLGLAAMFAKEMAITLPLMAILYDMTFFDNTKWRARLKKRWVIFLIGLAIIPITMFVTKSVVFSEFRRIQEGPPNIMPFHYLMTQSSVLATYIRLLFLPFGQNIDYDYPIQKGLFEPSALGGLLLLVAILVAAIKIFPKKRIISFSVFWFFITLAPESSIIPIEDVIFEHRLYLPMAGFGILLVSALYYFIGNNKTIKTLAILAVITLSYAVSAYARNFVWKDEVSLWSDAVKKSPNKARPYNNRGQAYCKIGRTDAAIRDYDKAIGLDPIGDAGYYYNRGNARCLKGNLSGAISDYAKAIILKPGYADAYVNRGNIYYTKGDLDKAIFDYTMAIRINPDYIQAYNNRGNAYYKMEEFGKAISDYTKAIELKKDFVLAYKNRMFAYLKTGEHKKWSEDARKIKTFGEDIPAAFNDELRKISER